jgi:PST family polysaccharide transporter
MSARAAPKLRSAGAAHAARGRHTYGEILRSSALIGGSSAVNVAVGIVRAKATAVLLGPAGFGLLGVYASVAALAQAVAGMGLSSSGVRQIAAAAGSGDEGRVARTAAVLRRVSVVLGVAGAALLALLAAPVSALTFGTRERTLAVAALSLAVLFRVVSDGQGALVQGLRRVGDVARIAVYGGLLGTAAAIGLVAALGERGVVPAVVAMAAATLVFSWWYSRKVTLAPAGDRPLAVGAEARALLGLGFAFMASGMLVLGAAYVVRLVLAREVGLGAAGLYQAAWTLGGLYVGFVLQAMGADFYPRLTAVVKDRAECNRIVNEQAQVSLLLAGPGILATLTLAPLVLSLLYSAEFAGAVHVLRWICLGATLQVVTWPVGFVIVAEGRRSIFLAVELAYALVHVGLALGLVRAMGVDGAGMAFFGSYVFHALVVYPVVRRMTGFRWSAANRRTGLLFLVTIAAVFLGFRLLPPAPSAAFGVAALLLASVHSARALARLVSPERLPRAVRACLARLRLVPLGGPGARS